MSVPGLLSGLHDCDEVFYTLVCISRTGPELEMFRSSLI